MKRMKQKNPEMISVVILLVVVFLTMFLLSFLTPLIADDYNYTMGYASGTRITSLSDIWQSMAWHRKLLNGRVVAHGLLSLVLMFPRCFFAALNGIVSLVFTWTTFCFFRDQNSRPVRSAIYVWMLTWICMPGFGQIFFWTSGACNYYWGITLAWIIVREAFRHQEDGPGIKETLLLLLPAFFAGAWSEHISFAMLMTLFLHAVGKWFRTKKVFPGELGIMAAGAAGYLFLMLAPASKLGQRLHDAGDPTENGNLTRILSVIPGGALTVGIALAAAITLYLVLKKVKGTHCCHQLFSAAAATAAGLASVVFAVRGYHTNGVFGMVSSGTAGFFLILCIFFTVLFFALKEEPDKDRILMALNLFFSGMCAFAMFVFGEYLPARAFCAPVLFTVLAVVLLAGGLKYTRLRETACYLVVTAAFAITFIVGLVDIVTVYKASVIREEGFREAAGGTLTLITSAYPCRSKYSAQYGNADLAPNADWPNGIMADYYGIVRIIVEETG